MASRDHPAGMTPSGDRPARLRILDLIRRSPQGMTVEDLAESVGLHVNTVRFHLDRLLAAGQVTRAAESRDRPGRPRLTFAAAPGPQLYGETRDYRLLAEILTGVVADLGAGAAPRAREVGRRWGASMAQKVAGRRPLGEKRAEAELVRVLDEVGFAPERPSAGDPRRVLLRHCPFLEAAEAHPEVVCSVHRGLMDGALAEMGAPLATERLVPFAEPAGCVAQLMRTG